MQMQPSGQTDPANSAAQNMEGESARQDGSSGTNVPTRLTMAADRQTVLRGSSVQLSGELRTQTGAPLPNRTVRILIGSPGARTPDAMRKLTTVTTDSSGQWKTTVAIPESTSIGRWSLVAQFPGDASNASSIAR
jgi:uncharacterized protein YfaS (alpha-2-macroglobulin family)